jgi:CBS domain-containing protein/anti-sigma regulatory factor (Ser/Thr protein kinase)
MKVGDVMTKDVFTIGPQDRMSSLRELLARNRISGLPVVEENRLRGLISIEDFIRWLADREDDCAIKDRMTQDLETMYADDPLVLAVSKFESTGLGRLPVLDRDSAGLVGIVTKGDVIRGLLEKLEVEYHAEEVRHDRASHLFEDLAAYDTTLAFRYEVKGQDFKEAGTSSSDLKKTLKLLGVQPDLLRRVAIACYELEMNQVVFTQGGTICANVGPDGVHLEAQDPGPGIADIAKALEPGYSTAPQWVRELGFGAGMGLVNIKNSGDRFEIQSELGKGTLVKVDFLADEDDRETC